MKTFRFLKHHNILCLQNCLQRFVAIVLLSYVGAFLAVAYVTFVGAVGQWTL